jgi:hypothetical protein
MGFNDGSGDSNDKSVSYYVRAVRSGQSRQLGHLVIWQPAQAARRATGHRRTILWDTAGIAGDVAVLLSRDGGKTYETISAGTPNSGSFDWTVTGPASANAALKIEPLGDPAKAAVQGLFFIVCDTVGDINGDCNGDLADAIAALQVLAGMPADQTADVLSASGADVNADGRIGIHEVVYVLQKLAGQR